MATTWGTIINRAKRRTGLPIGREDELLRDLVFLDAVNEVLSEFAGREGFREEFTLNLSGTVATHALSARLIKIEEGTVRVDYDGSGNFSTEPERADESTLRDLYGSLENESAGVPRFYYTQRGTAADAMLNLVLFPRSDTARTNGIKFWAGVSVTNVAALTDNVPVQQHEERFLLPGICYCLALTEANQNPEKLPKVALWERLWDRAKTDYADLVEDGLRGGVRRIIHCDPYD
jgi:hypothetical protein